MPKLVAIQDVLLRDYGSDELKNRIKELIDYSKLPVVRFEWTREAYEDLTSGGTPFTEPAKNVVSYREMNSSELASAVQEVILALPLVPGEVREMLYPKDLEYRKRTYCTAPRSITKQTRCLRCKGCINYIEVIDTIRGKLLEKTDG